MNTEGFERANYFGYEDDIMLEPSREWLEEHGDGPFLVTYKTLMPHHDYLAPTRYGRGDFVEDDWLNRYLNSVRYVDFFLKNLLDQYREMGLYKDTPSSPSTGITAKVSTSTAAPSTTTPSGRRGCGCP